MACSEGRMKAWFISAMNDSLRPNSQRLARLISVLPSSVSVRLVGSEGASSVTPCRCGCSSAGQMKRRKKRPPTAWSRR